MCKMRQRVLYLLLLGLCVLATWIAVSMCYENAWVARATIAESTLIREPELFFAKAPVWKWQMPLHAVRELPGDGKSLLLVHESMQVGEVLTDGVVQKARFPPALSLVVMKGEVEGSFLGWVRPGDYLNVHVYLDDYPPKLLFVVREALVVTAYPRKSRSFGDSWKFGLAVLADEAAQIEDMKGEKTLNIFQPVVD